MADGTRVYYLDQGPRTPDALVLVHGEPLSSWFWQHNIPGLSRGHRIISLDIRGRGKSGKTEYGHDIPQFAKDLRAILVAASVERFVGVGWSLGTSVLWSYVEQFGERRLRGLVNVDQRPYRWFSEDHLAALLAGVRSNRIEFHRSRIREYLGPEYGADDALIDRMTREWHEDGDGGTYRDAR